MSIVTRRDYFAGLALQALIAKAKDERRPASDPAGFAKRQEIAAGAQLYADAMIQELDTHPAPDSSTSKGET